jgi:hypothetical protein
MAPATSTLTTSTPATLAWTGLALATLAAAAPAQVDYTVDPIETPSGMFALYPSAINDSGVVVGWWYGSPVTNRHPFTYTQAGGYQPFANPAGFAYTVPMGINASGVIVGWSTPTWSDSTNPRGWRLENGVYSLFPAQTHGVGINSSGLIVGSSCIDAFDGSVDCVFLSSQPPQVQTIPAAGGSAGTMDRAIVVNDLGQSAYRTGPTTAVFRDADGTTIPLPGPPEGWTGIRVDGINNAGQVIARWTRSTTGHVLRYYSRGFVWTAAGGAQEFGIDAYSTRPRGINNLGQVLVESGTHDWAFFDCWLWSAATGPVNLDNKTDLGDNLVLTDLYALNDAGQIVAGGDTISPPVDIYLVLNPTTPPPQCGTADFDGDGDTGTDADIEAFFACLAGSCCPTCFAGGADFNGDGDTGTDADIESFFRVLAGGPC